MQRGDDTVFVRNDKRPPPARKEIPARGLSQFCDSAALTPQRPSLRGFKGLRVLVGVRQVHSDASWAWVVCDVVVVNPVAVASLLQRQHYRAGNRIGDAEAVAQIFEQMAK